MKKATVTYKAPPGDSKVVEMFGHTFFDGKPEDIELDDRAFGKIEHHPLFEVTGGQDDKPAPKHDDKPPNTKREHV